MYDPALQIRHHLCDEHMANLIETVMDAAVKAVSNPNYEFDDCYIRLDSEVKRMILNKIERIKTAESINKKWKKATDGVYPPYYGPDRPKVVLRESPK